MLIWKIALLDIILEILFLFLFYFGDTSTYNLVSVVVRVIAVKGTVCVCKDMVKLNSFRSILN